MKNLGAWTKERFFGGGIAVTCQEPSDAGTDDATLQEEIGAPEGLNLDSRHPNANSNTLLITTCTQERTFDNIDRWIRISSTSCSTHCTTNY
jgi:hypothetical protein